MLGGAVALQRRADVLEPGDDPERGLLGFALRCDGTKQDLLFVDGGVSVVVGAFAPDAPGAPGLFESYSTQTDDGGNFTLSMPPGHHVVWVSNGTGSVPYDIVVDGGSNLDLGNVLLYPPDSGETTGFCQGNIVIALPGLGAGADAGAIEALFGVGGTNFEINPPQIYPFSLSSQIPGLGTEMTQPLPPGTRGDVFCGLKDESGLPPGDIFNDLDLPSLPSFLGRPTTLGQITWLPNLTFADAGLVPPNDYPAATDAGADAGLDAGVDAGADAGLDAGVDAGPDAGVDAGPAAGPDAGPVVVDAGPPQWRLLGSVLVPDSGFVPNSLYPVDFDGGQAVLFAEGLANGVYLSFAIDGGYGAPAMIDQNSTAVFQAIADSRGVPLALVGVNNSDTVSYLLAPQANGTWLEVQPVDDAGNDVYVAGSGNLIPAGLSPNAWGVPASAYYIFQDPNTYAAIDVAAFTPPSGPLQVVATYPFLDGGYLYGLAAAFCRTNAGASACVAIQAASVDVMSIDLETGVGTQPYQIQESLNSPSNVGLSPIADGGLVVGWSEFGASEGTDPFVWVPALPMSAFACDPTTVVCAQPLQYSLDGLGEAGTELLLNLQGDPLLLFPFQDGGPVTGASPYYGEAAIDLSDLASLPLPGSAYLYATPGGFTDDQGRPVVALVADAGSLAAVEVYTYY